MAFGIIKALLGRGANSGVGGAAQGIGKAIGNTAKVFRVGADANDQRIFDSYANARAYVAQSWLGKQIRPWATIVILSPFLLLAIKLSIAIIQPLIIDMPVEVADANFAKAVAAFDQLGYLYYVFAGGVTTFWFGGQDRKYTRAHQESQANADRALAGASSGASATQPPRESTESQRTPHSPRKSKHSPEIEAWNEEKREEFFRLQANDR